MLLLLSAAVAPTEEPEMPTEKGQEVQYLGTKVDMKIEARDCYWRIRFPKGMLKDRPKALII